MLHSLISSQSNNRAVLAPPRDHLLSPHQSIVERHAADGQKDKRQVNPPDDLSSARGDVMSLHIRYQLRRQMDFALGAVLARAQVTLFARLFQVSVLYH